MNSLLGDFLRKFKVYDDIKDNIENNKNSILISGVSEENVSHIISFFSDDKKQKLIITKDDYKAKALYEDLVSMNSLNVELFPSKEIILYDMEASSHDTVNQRIKVLSKLMKKEKIVVIASIKSIQDKMLSKEEFKNNIIKLEYGKTYNLEDIIFRLVLQGYEKVNLIEGRGQISLRGGILDIYSPNFENPFRVEFFDDEIDSIREFDLKTQRSIKNLNNIEIYTTKEIFLNQSEKNILCKRLEEELRKTDLKNKNRYKAVEKLEKYHNMLMNDISLKNEDFLIPYIDKNLEGVLDYFSDNSLVIIEDSIRVEESLNYNYDNYISFVKELILDGEALKEHFNVIFQEREIIAKLREKNTVLLSNMVIGKTIMSIDYRGTIMSKSIPLYSGKLDLLVKDLNENIINGIQTVILAETKEKSKILFDRLKEENLDISYNESIEKAKSIAIIAEKVSKGLEYPDNRLSVISYNDIFGKFKKKKRKKRIRGARKISSFTDLKIGDHVVHESHGIGEYLGIEQLKVEEITKDYLIIKYSGEDKLYIPVDQMNLIQKYIGSGANLPKLSRLNSLDWQRTKSKVKKHVQDMAKDLIRLYAKRESTKGFSFSEDNNWQKEFEEYFPYEETEDQLKSIEEIKIDMQSSKVMDRLLCGDVGYGKTEVALRAMFKAVMDGKQVVFLVPTTILVQQHFNTIMKRLSNFPVNVESLSRFRSEREQKEIIKNLKAGNIDVLVGTHKVLSEKVKFKDLGLLIIDEEQRFGVKQKEKIKGLKETIDVLTLTATPIPRTLHMSLSGIRDMSVIEEPPEERQPVQTYVLEYNENMIKDVINKEVRRNGQVYFLYNKVKTIDAFTSRLKTLMPDLDITYAHGQMGEKNLEKTMLEFMNKEFDVLVCTTIIETGLDMENVNTIIVYDSDRMGLSQLYQLRGRVGRSNKMAFAYFTYDRDKILTEISEKRLKTIKEFTEFGSGFKIAMRDLEIRGAGNLLGAEQHGQMVSIGYDLYVKFLDKAIKDVKGIEESEDFETNIDLNIDGYIEDTYIEDEEQKIDAYKKIAALESQCEKEDLIEELIDRYGDIPKEVENLMNISLIKLKAKKAFIKGIKQDGNIVKFYVRNDEVFEKINLKGLLAEYKDKVKLNLSKNPHIGYFFTKQDKIISEINEFIMKMDGNFERNRVE